MECFAKRKVLYISAKGLKTLTLFQNNIVNVLSTRICQNRVVFAKCNKKQKALNTLVFRAFYNFAFLLGGERGIRTPGTSYPVRQFSKLVVSATHPPLQYFINAKIQKQL